MRFQKTQKQLADDGANLKQEFLSNLCFLDFLVWNQIPRKKQKTYLFITQIIHS